VIAVAGWDPERLIGKALALQTLLQNGYLTHVCISAELAEAVLAQANEPRPVPR
jgi:hypothetical protein